MSSEETVPQPRPVRSGPRPWVRGVAFVAVVATAWHVLASFLWIAPYSANAREIVPGNALSSYMLPMFGQSWSVFAPAPINGDYHFNVRAVIEDENGDEVETGWVSATDVELSMIQYNLFPPRAGIQSSEVASTYKNSFDKLSQAQKAVVASEYTDDGWEDVLRAAVTMPDDEASNQTPATEQQVDQFIDAEHLSIAYATQVARAIWGPDVERVQIRVSRQNIVPFAQRNDPSAQRPEPQVLDTGWRGLVVEDGQDDENFARVFHAQYERATR